MDVVLVTYNSEKWIQDCISALAEADDGGNDLNIYIVDNHSSDETCNIINKMQLQYSFLKVHLIQNRDNIGFGRANNTGAAAGNGEIICFLNVDTTVYKDTFLQLHREIVLSDEKVAAWEMRQFPYEHPKIYDPVSGETSWISGAAFAVRRQVFEKLGGFDESIFMYAEDVDLSWRIRAEGYVLKYCPKVKINHFSYQSANEVKPLQYINSICNNLLLRYRFGTIADIVKGHLGFWFVWLFHRPCFPGVKGQMIAGYAAHWKKAYFFWRTRRTENQVGKFLGWDYEVVRDGSFYCSRELSKYPKVSIIVRTCQRPEILREALISIRNQTYVNIEVVVVEDGLPSAENMIKNEFSDMNIKYMSTGERKGRSYAGNLALENATGEYINFLDDDDLFYCDHVETLVGELEHTDRLAAYAFGFETPIVVHSKVPYKYEIKGYNKRYTTKFDEVELCYHNFIPIQCIMFSRKLYQKYGGFDTTLDYLEDWDLWVRYSQGTRFSWVEKTTSLYRVPFERKVQKGRQDKLDRALITVRKKHEGYNIVVSAARLAAYGKKRTWEK